MPRALRCAFSGAVLAVLVVCAAPRPQPTVDCVERFTVPSYFGVDMARERAKMGIAT